MTAEEPRSRAARGRDLLGGAALAAAIGLAGCAGADDSPADGDSPADPDSPVTSAAPTRDCTRQLDDAEAELAATNDRVARLSTRLAETAERAASLEQAVDRAATGYPESVVGAAESVGVAARPSVVFLDVGSGQGTGWFVDETHVLTNSHNVAGGEDVVGWTVDGDRFDLDLVDRVASMYPDVALLRADREGPPLPVGSADAVTPGQPLVQVGHPGSVGNWIVSLGEFVQRQTVQSPGGDAVEELVTTVPGREGNSGSPLLTLDGRVVGVTYAGSPKAGRRPDESPEPAPTTVYDRPLAPKVWSNHVTVDAAVELVDDWL